MKKTVNLIKRIFERQFFRFLIVGGINTVIGYGTFALCLYLNIHYYTAYILSYVVGITNSYLWNKLFTFKSKDRSYKELIRFISVYLVSFIIGLIFLKVTVDIMRINEYIAGLINLIFTTMISWVGHNRFSFKYK